MELLRNLSSLATVFLYSIFGIGYITSAILPAIAAIVSLSPPMDIAFEITSAKLFPSKKALIA